MNPQLKKVTDFHVTFLGQPMVVHEEVRDLGFWLDKNMRLEKQVTKVGQAAYAHLRMLHRVRRDLTCDLPL